MNGRCACAAMLYMAVSGTHNYVEVGSTRNHTRDKLYQALALPRGHIEKIREPGYVLYTTCSLRIEIRIRGEIGRTNPIGNIMALFMSAQL